MGNSFRIYSNHGSSFFSKGRGFCLSSGSKFFAVDGSVFRTLPHSYVYLERTQSDGKVRRGIMVALDLEAYDYAAGSASPIRATEGTVEERLPPRVRVRRDAPLEMPHIMVLMDDRRNGVLGSLDAGKSALPPVYDFDLNCGGGHLNGWQVTGGDAKPPR